MAGPQNDDQWRWAEVLTIERMYGDGAVAFVAERIDALARAGDEAGVTRMREIAVRLDTLRYGGGQA